MDSKRIKNIFKDDIMNCLLLELQENVAAHPKSPRLFPNEQDFAPKFPYFSARTRSIRWNFLALIMSERSWQNVPWLQTTFWQRKLLKFKEKIKFFGVGFEFVYFSKLFFSSVRFVIFQALKWNSKCQKFYTLIRNNCSNRCNFSLLRLNFR